MSSKRDFEMVAEALRLTQPKREQVAEWETWSSVVDTMADLFSTAYERFNRQRFIEWASGKR